MIIFPINSESFRSFAPFWDESFSDATIIDANYFIVSEDDDLEIWAGTRSGVLMYRYRFNENLISAYRPLAGVTMGDYFKDLITNMELPNTFKIIFQFEGYSVPDALSALVDSLKKPDNANAHMLAPVIELLSDHSERKGPLKLIGPDGNLLKIYFEEPVSTFRHIVADGMELTLEDFMTLIFLNHKLLSE